MSLENLNLFLLESHKGPFSLQLKSLRRQSKMNLGQSLKNYSHCTDGNSLVLSLAYSKVWQICGSYICVH